MVVSTPLRNPCALACQSIKSLEPERERTLLASSSSSLKEPFKDLWKSITTWITLLYVVWPCFLKNCKNGSRHAFFSLYQCTSCQIEIWIITHANPRGSMGGCIFARLSDFVFCLGITRPWLNENVYLKVTNVCLHAKATNTFDTWVKYTWRQYLNS